jgi:nucleotide-binding universal stress UspA family protein
MVGIMAFDVIVVGTDGSETAGAALSKAVELAAEGGGALHVVHAHRLVSAGQLGSAAAVGAPTFDLNDVNHSIENQSRVICERAAEQATAAGVKKVETHTCPGDPADALVDVAEQVSADLVVVGNRGMAGVKRFVLGSVPNKVSHHCPCSLLIVDTRLPG